MAMVVETGSGVANADSYVSLVDAQAFIDARGLSATLTEGLLLRAMDALSTAEFKGSKTAATNSLSWPRISVTDCEGEAISDDAIPDEIVAAQIWLAYHVVSGNDPLAIATPPIKREKVDVIEVEYAVPEGSAVAVNPLALPNVKELLRCLLSSASTGAVTGRIYRA